MFIGLSPELELALYTLAVIYKPNDICKMTLGGQDVQIKTYVKLEDMNLESAYPLSLACV